MTKELLNNVADLMEWYVRASIEVWPPAIVDVPEPPEKYPFIVVWSVESDDLGCHLSYTYVYDTDFEKVEV